MTVEATDPTTLNAIGRAFAESVAMIVCVPGRYREAWNAFAAGLDAQLPANREALEAWWRAVSRGASL